MECSLRLFILTQRFLSFLRCESLTGFALSPRECLWLEPLTIVHALAMLTGARRFPKNINVGNPTDEVKFVITARSARQSIGDRETQALPPDWSASHDQREA
jgi:hypothetical protein